MKKLVCGKGVNDADYNVCEYKDGKQIQCPYYAKWAKMLKRCYSPISQKKNPTYKGCTVTKGWLTFSSFRAWMIEQDHEGKELDKDILVPGNRVYGPNTCMFIPHEINSLLNDHRAARGLHPQGVDFHKASKKFRAQISKYNKLVHIGLFPTLEQAESAYIEAKVSHIRNVAEEQTDRLADALKRHASLFEAKLV